LALHVCAREDGIRRSKDLRAEIGKFPNSTNERKKMSTKTIKQRIALVAASTLGASVLTLVSIAPANAAATILRDEMTISTSATNVLNEHYGVCYVASTTLDDADSTNTAELLSTGQARIVISSATNRDINDKTTFTLTGPAGLQFTGATSMGTPTLSSTGKVLSFTGTTTATNQLPSSVFIKPTGVGTIQLTVSEYDASADTSHQIEIFTLTSVASCGNAVADTVAGTFIRLVDSATVANAITYASGTSIDETDKNLAANAGSIYLRVDAYDVYGNAITETTSTLSVEVSAGATVAVTTATSAIAQAFTTDKSTYFTIKQATEDVPWSGTITVKLDGKVLGTKTAKIVGAPKTIEVSGLDIAQQGGSASTVGDYVIKDSAGNEVAVAVTGFTTLTEAQSKIITAGSSIRTPSQTTARTIAGTTKGVFQATCAASGAGATVTGLTLKYTNSALVTITSPAFSLTCGEAAYTYTASLDKASYVPGDIATLTISAKGQFGNPVHDAQVVGTNAAPISIVASNMTPVIAATNPDKFTAGSKTYQFIVGSTEGSYSMIVDLSAYNSTSTKQTAQTVPFKIASGTATVSNADVLKSIVALIASINKQIQALQKLILQRR